MSLLTTRQGRIGLRFSSTLGNSTSQISPRLVVRESLLPVIRFALFIFLNHLRIFYLKFPTFFATFYFLHGIQQSFLFLIFLFLNLNNFFLNLNFIFFSSRVSSGVAWNFI